MALKLNDFESACQACSRFAPRSAYASPGSLLQLCCFPGRVRFFQARFAFAFSFRSTLFETLLQN